MTGEIEIVHTSCMPMNAHAIVRDIGLLSVR
jgi:hypothetical protein